jgi:hypothetical protein
MNARIRVKREVAQGTLMVEFDLLGQQVAFRPGQFFYVTLRDPPYADARGPRRHFSVVRSPASANVLPAWAGALLMSLSTVILVVNARTLRGLRLREDGGWLPEARPRPA